MKSDTAANGVAGRMNGNVEFDRVASFYDETREAPSEDQIRALTELLGGCQSVLDAGVGTGRFAAPLLARGYDVVGVDVSLGMMRRARAKGVTQLARGDVRTLPLSRKTVDAAFMSHVLQLIPDPRSVLHELGRVARHAVVIELPEWAEGTGMERWRGLRSRYRELAESSGMSSRSGANDTGTPSTSSPRSRLRRPYGRSRDPCSPRPRLKRGERDGGPVRSGRPRSRPRCTPRSFDECAPSARATRPGGPDPGRHVSSYGTRWCSRRSASPPPRNDPGRRAELGGGERPAGFQLYPSGSRPKAVAAARAARVHFHRVSICSRSNSRRPRGKSPRAMAARTPARIREFSAFSGKICASAAT